MRSTKGTYSLVTLGCPKNLVDSERMLGLLEQDGYAMSPQVEGADFVVINTCGFVQSARDESSDTIREILDLKREGRVGGVIVTGCMVQRNREQILEAYPEVDQLVDVFSRDEIARAAQRLVGGLSEQRTVFRPATSFPLSDGDRLRVTPRHLAYLKIADGCDRLCTFCTIPSIRGKHVSKPMDQVVAEAEQLAQDGVRELILVAQDLTYYGVDSDGEPRLAELLDRLEAVPGIAWIRLMYLYPMYVTDALIERLGAGGKVLPYVDLPLQHISDEVLRRMSRRVNRAETEAILAKLRGEVPNLAVRTTVITGFPGETEAQFEELLEFVRTQRFERLGAFGYSREEGTPADRLDGHLPEDVIAERRDRILATQQEIAFAWNQAQVGRQVEVLLDGPVADQDNAWVGRSAADAPEIDGAVYVTGQGLSVGDFVPCEIVAARNYDLIAAAVGEPK